MVDFFAMYQNSRRINPFGFLKLKRATKTRNLINTCCLVQSAKSIFFLNYLTSIDFLQNVLLLVLQVPLVQKKIVLDHNLKRLNIKTRISVAPPLKIPLCSQ